MKKFFELIKIGIKKVKEFDGYREIFLGLLIASFLMCILSKYFLIVNIPSESMDTTLLVGDRVYVNTNIEKEDIQRGKIYTFHHDGTYYIKRCIGLEGDHIVIKDNEVYRNDELLEEDYVSSLIDKKESFDLDLVVPEGKVFFLGDNRKVSYDSRYWEDKFVNIKDIEGMATRIIFPFNRAGSLY